MKVSEAVEQLQVSPIVDDGLCVVTHRALATLLASHEALRLAGENLVGAFPPDMTGSGVVEFGADIDDFRALSLAVEDASK